MSTGLLTLAGQYWDALAQQGWAAVFFVAFGCSSLIIGSLSLSYIAISQYRERRESSFGNEHAQFLWKSGIPPTRDHYFRYVRAGDYATVERFWSAGIINITGDNGQSDLHIACDAGHTIIADELIRRGSDRNKSDSAGHTPLMLAAHQGHHRVVSKLIEHNAEINATSPRGGYSALFIAACNGRASIIDILLTEGGTIDAVDNNNRTPLMAAIDRSQWAIVEQLIERGADVTKIDAYGATMMDYAEERGAPDSIKQKLHDRGIRRADPPLKPGSQGFGWPARITFEWIRR